MILRRVLYGASALVVLAAAALVPMPVVEFSPGDATPVSELIEVSGETTPLSGDLDLLTVYVREPSMLETLHAWLSEDRALHARQTVIPTGVDRHTYFRLQEESFRRAFDIAVAVGAQAAGLEVTITTAAQVVAVLSGSPADGVLEAGDVIRTLDGTAITTSEALVEVARGAAVGDALHLTVDRDGATMELTVTAGEVAGLDHPGIGIKMETIEEKIELPVEVTLTDQRGIGGTSAGLMTALTVYDLLAAEDLARGRTIAGTGTMAASGRVGRIGGIHEKVITAIAAGADLMLVPADQLADAQAAAAGRVRLVGVSTMTEALEALRAP